MHHLWKTLAAVLNPSKEKTTSGVPLANREGYAAYGEDIFIISWFNHFGIDLSTIAYVDVGAAHPWKLNNTYLLYRGGAHGVLVEPDPDQAETLRRYRPNDVVINAGAAFDEQRKAVITRFSSPVFNTFSAEQAEKVLNVSKGWGIDQQQTVRDRLEVDLLPINEIIDQHLSGRGVDFLSIDVESKDLDVLRMCDFMRCRPMIVCIEASRDRRPIDDILLHHGYILGAFTPDNYIYMQDPFSSAWTDRAASGNTPST